MSLLLVSCGWYTNLVSINSTTRQKYHIPLKWYFPADRCRTIWAWNFHNIWWWMPHHWWWGIDQMAVASDYLSISSFPQWPAQTNSERGKYVVLSFLICKTSSTRKRSLSNWLWPINLILWWWSCRASCHGNEDNIGNSKNKQTGAMMKQTDLASYCRQ